MLNMGPLHEEVKEYMQNIIDKPGLPLSPNSSYKTGALHGEEWHHAEAVEAVTKLAPDLPYL